MIGEMTLLWPPPTNKLIESNEPVNSLRNEYVIGGMTWKI